MRSRDELIDWVMKLGNDYMAYNMLGDELVEYDDPEAKEVWWPVFWEFIHRWTEWVEDGKRFFVGLLKWLLPCHECSEHYEEGFEQTYVPWPQWAIDMHNKMNVYQWKEIYGV